MPTDPPAVLRLGGCDRRDVEGLLARFGLELVVCADGEAIPGSFWGDEEAGLQANRLYARADTPLHSILHEACHYICMPAALRAALDTDAGSDDAEENAVCYLQILLAAELDGMDHERMLRDMDAWGYSFRLGSSRAWFEEDADDALQWLIAHRLVDDEARPLWRLRGEDPEAA
jgi:hypothetical protein